MVQEADEEDIWAWLSCLDLTQIKVDPTAKGLEKDSFQVGEVEDAHRQIPTSAATEEPTNECLHPEFCN